MSLQARVSKAALAAGAALMSNEGPSGLWNEGESSDDLSKKLRTTVPPGRLHLLGQHTIPSASLLMSPRCSQRRQPLRTSILERDRDTRLPEESSRDPESSQAYIFTPRTRTELAQVLSTASQHDTPVVSLTDALGEAGTGRCRGSADSQLVISQEHMTSITVEQCADATVINAEPGVTWRDLRDTLSGSRSEGSTATKRHRLLQNDSEDGETLGFAQASTMEEFVLLLDNCSELPTYVRSLEFMNADGRTFSLTRDANGSYSSLSKALRRLRHSSQLSPSKRIFLSSVSFDRKLLSDRLNSASDAFSRSTIGGSRYHKLSKSELFEASAYVPRSSLSSCTSTTELNTHMNDAISPLRNFSDGSNLSDVSSRGAEAYVPKNYTLRESDNTLRFDSDGTALSDFASRDSPALSDFTSRDSHACVPPKDFILHHGDSGDKSHLDNLSISVRLPLSDTTGEQTDHSRFMSRIREAADLSFLDAPLTVSTEHIAADKEPSDNKATATTSPTGGDASCLFALHIRHDHADAAHVREALALKCKMVDYVQRLGGQYAIKFSRGIGSPLEDGETLLR